MPTAPMVKKVSSQQDIFRLAEKTYSISDDSINKTQNLEDQIGKLTEAIHSMIEPNDQLADRRQFICLSDSI